MSKTRTMSLAAGALTAIALAAMLAPGLGAANARPDDEKKAEEKKDDAKAKADAGSATAEWYKDPDCRLVFFAVLEGLYEDGVPTEAVDLIIGKESKLENKVKHNFVFQCELCHAVYEAFVLYQRRQTFNGSEADTFQDGSIDADLLDRLRAGEAYTRVMAMGTLVQPWIKRKLEKLDMKDEDQKKLLDRLHELAKKGYALTDKRRREDPDYGDDWRFYDACQACKAIDTVAKMRKEGK